MATLKDISKRTNLALSTVSYALNNPGRVSDETRQKVLKAAEELNYIPNGNARSLKIKKTNIIGVIIYQFMGPVFNEFLQGIQDTCINSDYDVIVSVGKHSNRLIYEKRVDGAIIFDVNIDSNFLQKIASDKFPICVVDREIQYENIYKVLQNGHQGSNDLTRLLIKSGYRNFAYIKGPDKTYDSDQRYEGFLKALKDKKIEFDTTRLFKGNFTQESGELLVKDIVKCDSVDAIVCGNDEMAIGVMNGLQKMGYKVPEDYAVVGFDDIELSNYVVPRLTTVKADKYKWGGIAAKLIMDKLEGKELEDDTIIIPTSVVNRQSVAIKTQ